MYQDCSWLHPLNSFLSMGIIYMFGGSHESDFHNVTRYGSKMCHRSVTGVTCDTTRCGLQHHASLFVYLFTFVIGTHVAFFVCLFPLPVVSDIDRQQANAKSDCTHCIRRGL